MYDILFQNGTVLSESGPVPNGFLAVRSGMIAYVGTEPPAGPWKSAVDLSGAYLSPGFIDAHTHGAGGHDFMDATPEAILGAARAHLKHGTTTVCPTSMASDDDALFRFLDSFEEAKAHRAAMPHMPGVHLEGPYFSPAQAGAQPPKFMKRPFPDHCFQVLERGRGHIVRWSCAPEVPGVLDLGDELVSRGILPSVAHTDADLALMERAMLHGFTHLTHFYSGMSMLKRVNGHRILGVVEAGYLYDALTLEIIADGVHLPPPLLRLIVKVKPMEKISLVTDSMRAAGMGDGPSMLGAKKGGLPVIVEEGVAKMPDRQAFAGSVATADRLVRVMIKEAGVSLFDAVRMMTQNPANLLGIGRRTGSIATGKAADLVIFDEGIRVRRVYVSGVEVPIDRNEEDAI